MKCMKALNEGRISDGFYAARGGLGSGDCLQQLPSPFQAAEIKHTPIYAQLFIAYSSKPNLKSALLSSAVSLIRRPLRNYIPHTFF